MTITTNSNATQVDPAILLHIKKQTGVDLCFAAQIIRLKNTKQKLILASAYFTEGENLSQSNIQRLKQFSLLATLTDIPVIVMGDFNIHVEDLAKS